MGNSSKVDMVTPISEFLGGSEYKELVCASGNISTTATIPFINLTADLPDAMPSQVLAESTVPFDTKIHYITVNIKIFTFTYADGTEEEIGILGLGDIRKKNVTKIMMRVK